MCYVVFNGFLRGFLMLYGAEQLADVEVGVKTLEAILGVSEQYIGRLVRDGVLVKSGRGAYPLMTCVQAFLANLRDKQKTVSTNADGSQKVNAATELALLRQKQGTLIDIRIQTEAGLLVRTAEAERIYGEVLRDAKMHFSALPNRMASLLEGLNKKDIQVELHRFVSETLKRLSAPANLVDHELLNHVNQIVQKTSDEIEQLEQNGGGNDALE